MGTVPNPAFPKQTIVDVVYRSEPGLDVLVPARMWEWYWMNATPSGGPTPEFT